MCVFSCVEQLNVCGYTTLYIQNNQHQNKPKYFLYFQV